MTPVCRSIGIRAHFYFVTLEGTQIDYSLPAPLLTAIVGPSEESREVGEVKRELKYKFWLGPAPEGLYLKTEALPQFYAQPPAVPEIHDSCAHRKT